MACSVKLIRRENSIGEEKVFCDPGERRDAILDVIRSARQRLILSLFRCTDFRVLGELAAAVERGVRVDALMTPRARGWRTKLEDLGALLESMGVRVHGYSRLDVKYHAKYLVADDDLAAVASLNFTRKCFRDTCDFVITTRDRGVVQGLQSLFEADRRPGRISFSECITGRLIIGPERARAGVAALLAEARRSIRIIDHRVRDPWMLALLESRRAEGIAVETLGRGALGNLLSHGKLILIDNAAALAGSLALSTRSLDLRRELAIVVRDPHCVRRLNGLFRTLAGAEPPGNEEAS
jgi:phosphatidylserine/phosphatidylglycerophosphate/cardiolipin synthase-like enzyme